MQVSEVVEKVLAFLAEFDEAIDIAMMVCMILINKKCSKIVPAPLSSSSVVASSSSSNETAQAKALSVITPSEAQKKSEAKKKLRSEMLLALDTMFSEKSDSELSEVEQLQVNKVLGFINGGS